MTPPRRILVTGAGGFVGRHLLPVLAASLPDAVVVPARMDLRDAGSIRQAVREARPDACIHLAAIAAIPIARHDPGAAWQINLSGTLTLARTLLADAPGCRLLFVSTADAYGRSFNAGRPLNEAAALAPINTYGATKAAADLALGAMVGDGLDVVRLRPFNHTGPGQSTDFALPAFGRQLARICAGMQPPVLRVGTLDTFRDFLDVRDVCQAYARCLVTALPSGTILNIASGTSRRLSDVLDAMIRLSGAAVSVEQDPDRLRPAEIRVAGGDAAVARSVLGWAPAIDWDTTLADLLADWRLRVQAETAS